jgi:TPR repeat protein
MLKKSVIISICLLLQACTSAVQMHQYDEGKSSFTSGDYKSAFHQLLPLAAADNMRAQYAVGYMYYYGYGVTRDAESGLFWMQKSAAQHYAPAEKALDLIAKNNATPPKYT